MNKKYIYCNGKAKIIKDNNESVIMNYYDNLDKVLIKENLLEIMEKKLKTLESKDKKNKANKTIEKMNKNKWLLSTSVIFIPIIWIYLYLILKMGLSIAGINKIISISSFVLRFITPVILAGSSFIFILNTIAIKLNKKHMKGELAEIGFLKLNIEKTKQEINELKMDKTSTQSNKINDLVIVRDEFDLREFKDKLDLYYDLGCNEEKYSQYLKDGVIDNKLNNYSKDELIVIKEYLKSKQKRLIKKL